MKKTIAMLLAAVMLCGCLAGCGGTKDDTVMTVNGTEISYDEYMTWLGSAVSDIKSIYSTYSGTDVDWDGNFLFDAQGQGAGRDRHRRAERGARGRD